MTEKFCLKWNEFHTNASESFRKLRNNDDFHDVTLVSDDQQQVSAHKVVLSSSSEYFKNILKANKHSHPMLCLSGVNAEDLKNILDFVYNGEIQIYNEYLDQFLDIAHRFKLKGLIQGDKEFFSDRTTTDFVGNVNLDMDEIFTVNAHDKPHNPDLLARVGSSGSGVVIKKANIVEEYMSGKEDKYGLEFSNQIKTQAEGKIYSVKSLDFEMITELDYKIDEMMVKVNDGSWQCVTCGRLYDSKRKSHLKEHVENNHIHMEGLRFPCKFCDKTFRTRSSLRMHKDCEGK